MAWGEGDAETEAHSWEKSGDKKDWKTSKGIKCLKHLNAKSGRIYNFKG